MIEAYSRHLSSLGIPHCSTEDRSEGRTDTPWCTDGHRCPMCELFGRAGGPSRKFRLGPHTHPIIEYRPLSPEERAWVESQLTVNCGYSVLPHIEDGAGMPMADVQAVVDDDISGNEIIHIAVTAIREATGWEYEESLFRALATALEQKYPPSHTVSAQTARAIVAEILAVVWHLCGSGMQRHDFLLQALALGNQKGRTEGTKRLGRGIDPLHRATTGLPYKPYPPFLGAEEES